ncbi:MAG: hypothetical protein QNJ47_07630 [Nostocaceae cyanobacterium]|nr:hypothetical protein [Nostocaceae cyanobacterium]
MDKQQISQFIGVRYIYLGLGVTLTTSLLSFTPIAINPGIAAEIEQNQFRSSFSRNKDYILSKKNVTSDTDLREKLVLYKANKNVALVNPAKISDGLGSVIKGLQFGAKSGSDLNADVVRNVVINQKAKASTTVSKKTALQVRAASELNGDLIKNLRAVSKVKKVAQIDSSGTVGDTLAETNRLRQELLIPPIIKPGELPVAVPGSSAGTPTAYGASWRQAFIGAGVNFPLDEGRTDGALAVGFGLGDPAKAVGLEVTASITSVGGGDDFDFGDSGGLGFKVHKFFSDGTAVAVGWANAVKWGDADDEDETIYGVVTRSFPLEPNSPTNKLPLTVSLGIGSGSFRSRGAIEADENNPNFFGSVGLRATPQVSLISSWTGNRLNVGTSFVPLKKVPVVVHTFFTDVTSNFDDGIGLTVSAGYAFQF